MVEEVPVTMEVVMEATEEVEAPEMMMKATGQEISMAMTSYLFIAVMNLWYNLGLVYRYMPTAEYTAAANIYGSDIFKWLEWIYAGMNYSFWAVLLVFQLLALGGMYTHLNLMLWTNGVWFLFYGSNLYQITRWIFRLLAVNANSADGNTMVAYLDMRMAHVKAIDAISYFTFGSQYEAFKAYQFIRMDDEMIEMYKESEDEKMEESMEEVVEEATGDLFRFLRF